MSKNKIINSYEKQLEVYEKIPFLKAKELISNLINEEDKEVRKKNYFRGF